MCNINAALSKQHQFSYESSYWVAPTSVYICPEARRIDNLSTALDELAEASPAASSYQVTVRLTGLILFTYILSWNTEYC